MNKCDPQNTKGITCKSNYSILRFFRDKVITTGVLHNQIVVADNVYKLVPLAEVTNQLTITDDTQTE